MIPKAFVQVEKIRAIRACDGISLDELLKIAGLDPKTDFRHGDFFGIIYGNCEIDEFDFYRSDIRQMSQFASEEHNFDSMMEELYPGFVVAPFLQFRQSYAEKPEVKEGIDAIEEIALRNIQSNPLLQMNPWFDANFQAKLISDMSLYPIKWIDGFVRRVSKEPNQEDDD